MIKMVVSSFHNTLIDNEEAIPMSTMLEIERIRKKGIILSICTNRQYKEVLDYNEDFPFVDYIISLNGSYIYDVKKEKVLFKKKLTNTIIKKILNLLPEYKLIFYSEDNIYESISDIEAKDIYKIEIEAASDIETIKEKLKKISVNITTFEINQKKYIEITSNQASMFNGVDKVSLKNNIILNNVLAICGNESDCPLVQNIQNSYVVKNCSKKLKKYTKKQTLSNVSKGVENIIRKMV